MTTNSAEPEKLLQYARVGDQIVDDIRRDASNLTARLQHFESRCLEPDRVRASHLGGELRNYGNYCAPTNDWVARVARRFQQADSVWGGLPILLTPSVSRFLVSRSGHLMFILPQFVVVQPLMRVPDWLRRSIDQFTWRPPEKEVSIPSATSEVSTPHVAVTTEIKHGPLITALDQAQTHHVNQFAAEKQYADTYPELKLSIGNADCGPASLVVALSVLGLSVKGASEGMTNGEKVLLARKSMFPEHAEGINLPKDGVNAEGRWDDAEHSKFTTWAEIEYGAEAAGVEVSKIDATAAAIRQSLEGGAVVVISGTFAGKTPLPWTGDRGHDNNTAPGGATAHVVTVTGYDHGRGLFIISDPARVEPLEVSGDQLASFLKGNAGARSLTVPEP